MALTYDFTNIRDYKTTVWIPEPTEENPDAARMNPVTEVLIFGTMSVGLGSITDKNVDEFAARFRIIEKVHGPMLSAKNREDRYVTDEEFIAHIGLVCNVSNETRSQWARRLFVNKRTSVTDQLLRSFHSATKAAA
jgi:hypothetical protein